MIKASTSINSVKTKILSLKGRKVEVKVNLGRNKSERFTGVLTDVYPALFTVTPVDKEYKGKTSYSYSEYLCGNVILNERLS